MQDGWHVWIAAYCQRWLPSCLLEHNSGLPLLQQAGHHHPRADSRQDVRKSKIGVPGKRDQPGDRRHRLTEVLAACFAILCVPLFCALTGDFAVVFLDSRVPCSHLAIP